MPNPPHNFYSHDQLGLDPDDPGAAKDLREYLEEQEGRPFSDEEIQDILHILRRLKTTMGLGIRR
jgi:hypothetical protein